MKQDINPIVQAILDEQTNYITPLSFNSIDEITVDLDVDKDYSCDIETTSLNVYDAELVSISFTDFEGNTTVYLVNHSSIDNPEYTQRIKLQLKYFIEELALRKRKLIFHKANYDIPVLIKNLYVSLVDSSIETFTSDVENKIIGCKVFRELTIEDTLLMHYLLYNSTSGNSLGLKDLIKEIIPDYKLEDIKNVFDADILDLLKYNALDTIATSILYTKYEEEINTAEREKTLDLYKNLFIPILHVNIRTQLFGLPIDKDNLEEYKELIDSEYHSTLESINKLPVIEKVKRNLRRKAVEKYNSTHKVKQITEEDKQAQVDFNPGSTQHVSELLYTILELPVLERTPKGVPSATTKTLNNLLSITDDPVALDTLSNLIQLNEVKKIYTAFLPTFLDCPNDYLGNKRLYSYFNLGGTISGRLSCNNFNQQQLPATGSKYAKPTKKIFKAPPGWLIVGSDFKSLENMISALTTSDPAKLSVYTQGYDGHCKNAYAYWGHLMPDIKTLDENSEVKCYIYEDTVLTEDDEVEYQGKIIKIKDLYV